ncbi:MAG: hypothetical protein ISR47_08980 [Rhodospirillales bacterium]|nr:hypothetical protein [Rhodospirillales bacterium]
MVTDPAIPQSSGPDWVEVTAEPHGNNPDWIEDPANPRGASPDWIEDPAKPLGASPDWVEGSAEPRRIGPDWVENPAKPQGAGPDWAENPSGQHRARPDWIEGPTGQRRAGPAWAENPSGQHSARPDWVDGPTKHRRAGPDWAEGPANQRSPDAGMSQAGSSPASKTTQMDGILKTNKDDSASLPDDSKHGWGPPEEAVNTFVTDLASVFDRLGVEIAVKQRDGLKIEFSTQTQALVVAFEAHELPFNKVVVKQQISQVRKTKKRNVPKHAQPQGHDFLAPLTALLGRKTGKGAADKRVSKDARNRTAPAQDEDTRSFSWNGTRLTPGAASEGNDRNVLTAELFENSSRNSWLIKLIDGRQAVGGKQDAGKALSPAGIRRLLAPLLGGLGSAMHGEVGTDDKGANRRFNQPSG